ncbi:hypothetical protein [Nitrosomonas ureae]|uniref:hypothetical protein n=1 Tax=Nitrosomonas ureae TaxID=44577 RepID=UPI000BB8EC1F|nr:hypothetical protein [Nitrosomonas ureae]
MNFLWFLLHTAILSAISTNSIQVSADQPTTQSAAHAVTAESEIARKRTYFQRARSYSTHPESGVAPFERTHYVLFKGEEI